MIVTHTINANGHRRVYLGGKSSIECWVEPDAAGNAWTFHIDVSPTGFPLPGQQLRDWAIHTLLSLADMLGVAAADLKAVPFERITALHSANPAEYRRLALPRRHSFEHGFMATAPNITRPQADFVSPKASDRRSCF